MRNWAELNHDLLLIIFVKVGATDLLQHTQFVCKPWRNVSFSPYIWKVAHFTKEDCVTDVDLEKMTREAVDRSKCEMEELWINGFGSDSLLNYVADRTSMLKCLRLISVYKISDEGLISMVKKQPKLEELEISFGAYLGGTIKEIGKACPNLRCFRFNHRAEWLCPPVCDGVACDIANNMNELRTLQLIGNRLGGNGLNEILIKCKHLESLDIRCCFSAENRIGLSYVVIDALKEFWSPFYPLRDYEFAAKVDPEDIMRSIMF